MLVGVVCQRLDFVAAHHLRVPRCEILLASTAAKGTLRAGQFSQIPNVILSGGEEGMWTFERYQRWMEQKTDWVQPALTQSALAEQTVKVVNLTPTPSGPPPARTAPEPQAEISIDEDVDLNELARQIEERMP